MKDNKGNDFSVEPINVDLNQLFSLSYTFDNLKSLMNKLLENQKTMVDKINDLNKKCKHGEAETKKLQTQIIPAMDKKIKLLESIISRHKKESKKKDTEIQEEKPEKKPEVKRSEKQKKTKKEKEAEKQKKSKKEKEEEVEKEKETQPEMEKEVKSEIKKEDQTEIEKETQSEMKKEAQSEMKSEVKKETEEKSEENEENLEEKNLENENIEKEEDENIEKSENQSSPKKEIEKATKKENTSSESNSENDEEYSSNYLIPDEEENSLKERITALEQKVESLQEQISKNKPKILGPGLDSNKNDVEFLKLELKSLSEKFDGFVAENSEMKQKMDEILIKVTDFDIYDILGECKLTDGSIDVTKLLVKNLEEKVFKKTNIIDDKIKKLESDMYKTKNESQTVKNQSEVLNSGFNEMKNSLQQFGDDIQKTLDINFKKTDDDIKDSHKKMLQRLEEEKNNNKKILEKIKKKLKNISTENYNNNEDYNIKVEEGGLSDKDLKLLGDFSKRICDLEKQTKNILNVLDITKNKEDIARIENEVNQKTNQKDFFELSDKMNLTNTNINNLRDMIDRVSDISNKNMNDLNFFLKKIESLSASVLEVNTTLENLIAAKDENKIDPDLFISVETFNEFIKAYHKSNKITERSIDELRRILNDFGNVLKTKTSEDDMKNFEIIYNNKIEELKLMCTKKFSDKNDTNKTFKYLDAQIKHIYEMISKKNDKNENWLIAKKPVGYCCASCDSYLGELKEKGEYIAWNRYPHREREKNYRVGNGFSRMLNMLNLEVKSSVDNIKELSMEENKIENNNIINTIPTSPHLKTSSSINNENLKCANSCNKFNKSNLLPKINNNESISNDKNCIVNNFAKGRNTCDNLKEGMSQSDLDTIDKNENGPHIVRVIKKNKLV